MKLNIKKLEAREKKHFNEAALAYDTNYGYEGDFTKYKIDKKVLEFVSSIQKSLENKPISILEIGCGTGEYTKRICNYFPKSKIIAIDISEKILQVAKKKCAGVKNVRFLARSAYSSGFKSDFFDVVFGFYVLHHLDIPRFKNELLRVLKKKGLAFFYEPNILNPVVYIIKSNRKLKSLVGDSKDEWAINPLTLNSVFKDFKVINISMSEFIYPARFIPLSILKTVDKIFDNLKFIPLVKYLGGSVQIFLRKK